MLKRHLGGSLQNHGAREAGIECFFPSAGTYAPAVAWFEAGKAIHRHRSAEIVSASFAEFEEVFGDRAANGVAAMIFRTDLAPAVAIKTCERIHTAWNQVATKNVFVVWV